MKNINAIHCTIEEEEGNKQQPDSMKNINAIHCTICNQIINTKPLLCKDYTVSGETFSIFKCDNCQYGFTHPQPNPNNIGKYYSSPDYSPHANYVKNVTDVLYNVARTFNVKNKVKLVKNIAKTPDNINIADIGCGTGHFLYQCKKQGMIVQGVEVNQQAKNITEKRIGQKIFQSVDELIDSVTGKTDDYRQGKQQKKLEGDELGDSVTGKTINCRQGELQKELSIDEQQMIFFVNQGGGGLRLMTLTIVNNRSMSSHYGTFLNTYFILNKYYYNYSICSNQQVLSLSHCLIIKHTMHNTINNTGLRMTRQDTYHTSPKKLSHSSLNNVTQN